MTRRAPARSATISRGAATLVLPKTQLAPRRTGALQLTRSSVRLYGRVCPVHVWPVLNPINYIIHHMNLDPGDAWS